MRNLLTSGTLDTLDNELRRRVIILNLMIIAGFVMLTAFGTIALFETNVIRAIIDYALAFFIVALFVAMRIFRTFHFASYAATIAAGLVYLYIYFSPGPDSSGAVWLLSFPVIAIFNVGLRPGVVFSIVCVIVITASYVLGQIHTTFEIVNTIAGRLGSTQHSFDFVIRTIGTFIIIMLFSAFYEYVRTATQARLEEANLDLERTSQDLLNRKQQTDSIFKNVNDGIFLLNKSLCFDSEYSHALEGIINKTKLTKVSFLDILKDKIPEKAFTATADYLEMFFSPNANLELLADINPLEEAELNFQMGEGGFKTKYLEFAFARIGDEERLFKILGTVRDVTPQRELANQLLVQQDRNKKQMENLFQIIQVEPRLMKEFIADAEEELENVNAVLKSDEEDYRFILDTIYQSAHAIKGNAVLLGLETISGMLHHLEDDIRGLQDKEASWDDLFQLTVHLTEIQNELEIIRQLIDKIVSFQSSMASGSAGQRNLMLSYIERVINRLQEDLGKEVILSANRFSGDLISPRYRKTIKDVIIQLTRNALAHGIESPEERSVKNKQRIGTISIATERQDGNLTITFRDDGRGFDADKIRARAKQLAMFQNTDIDSLSNSQVIALVFREGFTSSDTATMHSGRGVGLRLVKNKIEAGGGTFKIRSAKDKYSEFVISFPT